MLRHIRLIVIVLVVISCLSSVSAQPVLKETIRTFITDVYNNGNVGAVDVLFAPGYIRRPGDTNASAFKIGVLSFRAAMPDLQASVEVILEDTTSRTVAARFRLKGTFTNEYIGPDTLPLQPNNQLVEIVVNVIYRFDEAGQVIEEWDGFDNLRFLGQLGVIPSPTNQPAAPMLYPDVVDVGMSDLNRDLVQRYFEAFNQGDFGFINTNFKDDLAAHNPFGTLDRSGLVGDLTRLRQALPDLRTNLDELVTEGNWTAARYTLRGTFTANFVNVDGSISPPTGRSLSLPIITFFRFEQQGLVAEIFELYDGFDFLSQLGLINLVAVSTPTQ